MNDLPLLLKGEQFAQEPYILKTINVRNTKRYSHHVQNELNILGKNGLICFKYAEVVKL